MALSLQSAGAVRWVATAISIALMACGGGDDGGLPGGLTYDYDGPAARRYAELCAVCHGEAGEGGLGPALLDSPRDEAELAEIIDDRMPANDPAQCDAACAAELAAFIKEGLTSEALSCERVPPSRRRLRLLTRREYAATVRDLFGATARACGDPSACEFREECTAARCQASPCGVHTFAYAPAGAAPGSVHVAGSFNGWAGTVEAGGWPLARDPVTGVWSGRFAIPPGAHAYKLVVDGVWLSDPRAPSHEPDGFGGDNAILIADCAGDALTAGFPIETRPSGFFFDDDADAAIVTAAHLDAYLGAARPLADRAVDQLAALTGCDVLGQPEACAAPAIEAIGRRVFRRPLTADERARYVALVGAAPDARAGYTQALHALLVSPHFLYRSELGTPRGDGTYQLTGWEIATALAYTLWGTTPDDALLAAAEAGELDDAAGIERHARRMLADPRARGVFEELIVQWLGVDHLATLDKHAGLFPEVTPTLRAAMDAETRRFASAVAFDRGGTFAELLTADWTYVTRELAALYGLPGVTSDDPVVAEHADGRRAGLLGHAGVLASHAHSDQSSPIRRGLLVRRRFLCQDLPPPPPTAGGVPEIDPDATTAERFAQHTADPVCAGCHQYIDPIGMPLETFDAIGRYRDAEAGRPLDPTGDLNDVEGLGSGTSAPFASLPELAGHLAASDAAPSCFVRQYLRFARGRRETLADRCARRALEADFAAAGGDLVELVVGALVSPDFAVRR